MYVKLIYYELWEILRNQIKQICEYAFHDKKKFENRRFSFQRKLAGLPAFEFATQVQSETVLRGFEKVVEKYHRKSVLSNYACLLYVQTSFNRQTNIKTKKYFMDVEVPRNQRFHFGKADLRLVFPPISIREILSKIIFLFFMLRGYIIFIFLMRLVLQSVAPKQVAYP